MRVTFFIWRILKRLVIPKKLAAFSKNERLAHRLFNMLPVCVEVPRQLLALSGNKREMFLPPV
jgi:hypothetical protein